MPVAKAPGQAPSLVSLLPLLLLILVETTTIDLSCFMRNLPAPVPASSANLARPLPPPHTTTHHDTHSQDGFRHGERDILPRVLRFEGVVGVGHPGGGPPAVAPTQRCGLGDVDVGCARQVQVIIKHGSTRRPEQGRLFGLNQRLPHFGQAVGPDADLAGPVPRNPCPGLLGLGVQPAEGGWRG